MNVLNITLESLAKFKRRIQIKIVFTFVLVALISTISLAQGYHKSNAKFYKSYYRKQNARYTKACDLLDNKRSKTPKKSIFANRGNPKIDRSTLPPRSNTTAKLTETKPTATPITSSTPKPKAQPLLTPKLPTPKIEHISDEQLVKLHKKEDEVLLENKLPVPSSAQHEKIRKQISDKLTSKTNIYPLQLAPLYFTFDEDEFSVVDMEPFLIAAEYALQGRTVLVEGHTDDRGADDYNVKLSIKRVQKIRQLMLDMGVPDDRISLVGYGEELKKTANNTTQGRQTNRRVDFVIF